MKDPVCIKIIYLQEEHASPEQVIRILPMGKITYTDTVTVKARFQIDIPRIGLHCCCIWERSTNLFREQLITSHAKSSFYLFCSTGLCNGGWSANSGYFRIGFRLPSLTKEKQNPQSLKDKKQTVSLSVNLILLNPVWDYFHYCITVAIVLWIYLPRS